MTLRLPLMSNAHIRKSDQGSVTIPETQLTHGDDPKGLADKLSEEYTRMSQENPDYEFGILHDNVEATIKIWWKKLE